MPWPFWVYRSASEEGSAEPIETGLADTLQQDSAVPRVDGERDRHRHRGAVSPGVGHQSDHRAAGGFDPDETSRREHLHVDRHQVLDIRSQAAEVEDQVRRGLREAREPYVGPRALGVQIGARRVQTGGHRFDDLVRDRGIDAEKRLLGFGGNPLVGDKPAFLHFGGRGKDFLLAQEGQYVGIRPCDRADDPLEG